MIGGSLYYIGIENSYELTLNTFFCHFGTPVCKVSNNRAL